MRHAITLLLVAMLIAALFAFSGLWDDSPVYTSPMTITPYEFAGFLFWMFLLLFLLAVVVSSTVPRRNVPRAKTPAEQQEDAESAVGSGFLLALFFVVIAGVAAVFGFGVVASAFAGLAMIVFWISVVLALVAFSMGFIERRR